MSYLGITMVRMFITGIRLTIIIYARWYHGRLDRFTAEERLWDASKMGSYLVRESDRKPGSYVLSYLGRTGINHFRITAVCGDYYIGTAIDLIQFLYEI